MSEYTEYSKGLEKASEVVRKEAIRLFERHDDQLAIAFRNMADIIGQLALEESAEDSHE